MAHSEIRKPVKHAGLGAGPLDVAGLLAILEDKVVDTKDLVAEKVDSLRERGSEADAQILDVATDDEVSVRPIGREVRSAMAIGGQLPVQVVKTVIDRQGARLFEIVCERPGS